MGVLGAVIGGISSIFGGGVSAYANKKAVQEQNRGNMELARYQYARDLEMWNRQNDYNTPLHQRQRAEEAGLNPNLLYGHGSLSNTSAPAPSFQAPTMQAYTGIPNLVDAGITAINNILATRADVEVKRSQSIKNVSEAVGQNIANALAKKYGDSDRALNNTLKRFEVSLEEKRSQYYDDLAQAERDKNVEGVNLIKAEIEKVNQTIDLLKAQYTTESYKPRLLAAQAGKSEAEIPYVIAKTETERRMPAYYASATDKNYAAASELRTSAQLNVQKTISQSLENQYIAPRREQELKNLAADYEHIYQDIKYLAQKGGLTEAQTQEMFVKVAQDQINLEWLPKEKQVEVSTKVFRTLSHALGPVSNAIISIATQKK